jgi:hypothetical protein
MALCSLSTGRMFTPLRFAASVTASPAMTRISLLATARCMPALDGGEGRSESGGADDGDEDHVGVGRAAEEDDVLHAEMARQG